MVEFNIEQLRTKEMSDFKNDPDKEDMHFGINWEKTRKLQAMPKY